MIDWSKAPEGATHWGPQTEPCSRGWNWIEAFYKIHEGVEPLYSLNGEWRDGVDDNDDWSERFASLVVCPTTPTIETMLTEWRDLEARARATQAEADALVEQAAQLHSAVTARLAELGWGAPVVTLDDSVGWNEWNGGECPVAEGTLIDQRLRDGREYFGSKVGQFGNSTRGMFWRHDGDGAEVVAYRLSPSTQP